MIARRFTGIRHQFHELILHRHIMRPIVARRRHIRSFGVTVHLPFAHLPRRHAYRYIFERTAEAAHHVPFEMRQHQNRIVSGQSFAHFDTLQMQSAVDGEINAAVFVHDVDGTKRPAVDLERLSVLCRRVSGARVHRVRFDDVAVRNVRLQFRNHVARQDIRTVRFTRVQFDSDLAVNRFADHIVEFDQMSRVNLLGEINFRRRARALLDEFRANNRRLRMNNRAALDARKRQTSRRRDRRRSRQFEKISPVDVH